MKKKSLFKEVGRSDVKNPVTGYDACSIECDASYHALCTQNCGNPEAFVPTLQQFINDDDEFDNYGWDHKYEPYYGLQVYICT